MVLVTQAWIIMLRLLNKNMQVIYYTYENTSQPLNNNEHL
jgi:hypothetical protein